jgi:hypothetical protein
MRVSLVAGHPLAQPHLVLQRPYKDDDAVIAAVERVDQSLHERNIHAAE